MTLNGFLRIYDKHKFQKKTSSFAEEKKMSCAFSCDNALGKCGTILKSVQNTRLRLLFYSFLSHITL